MAGVETEDSRNAAEEEKNVEANAVSSQRNKKAKWDAEAISVSGGREDNGKILLKMARRLKARMD